MRVRLATPLHLQFDDQQQPEALQSHPSEGCPAGSGVHWGGPSLERLHGEELKASPEVSAALDCPDKRLAHMNYGWPRQNGCYVGTARVEAEARPLVVARRCKQAGMHWRAENAARVCALLARYRFSPTPAACVPPATKQNRTPCDKSVHFGLCESGGWE